MNVLVTGGAGYIGSVVAQELLKAGHRVTVFDSLIKGHRAAVPEGTVLVVGDIHDRVALDTVMGNGDFDAVVHFAAFIEAGESMHDPARYFYNNTAGSLSLIDAAASHGIRRFVFSSTAAVYAGKDAPLRENDPLVPANVYGASKLMVEQMLAWYHRVKGLRFAALRYFNACGATPGRGENHRPETHLIPLVLQVALGQREHIAIYGTDYPTPDGTCIRDYIHVLDLAAAHLRALDALAQHETLICNLGNGNGFSVREVIETARLVTGHADPGAGGPPPSRRRSYPRRRRRPGPPGAWLAARHPRSGGDHRQRLGVAPLAPAGIHPVTLRPNALTKPTLLRIGNVRRSVSSAPGTFYQGTAIQVLAQTASRTMARNRFEVWNRCHARRLPGSCTRRQPSYRRTAVMASTGTK